MNKEVSYPAIEEKWQEEFFLRYEKPYGLWLSFAVTGLAERRFSEIPAWGWERRFPVGITDVPLQAANQPMRQQVDLSVMEIQSKWFMIRKDIFALLFFNSLNSGITAGVSRMESGQLLR